LKAKKITKRYRKKASGWFKRVREKTKPQHKQGIKHMFLFRSRKENGG
jgi:predicted LPLAT superfamily acyltransferase